MKYELAKVAATAFVLLWRVTDVASRWRGAGAIASDVYRVDAMRLRAAARDARDMAERLDKLAHRLDPEDADAGPSASAKPS